MTITSPNDPTSFLATPSSSTGSFIWEVRMQSGIVVATVDTLLSFLTGFSPLEEWIVKPFGGGWDAVDQAGQAWSNSGKAIARVSDNIASVPGQIGERWTGETATAFDQAQNKIAMTIKSFPDGCEALSEACKTLAEVAKLGVKIIAGIIGCIVDMVIEIAILLAGVVTAPAAEVPAANVVAHTPSWIEQVSEIIIQINEAIEQYEKFAGPILEQATAIAGLVDSFNNARSTVKAQTDIANAAFAV